MDTFFRVWIYAILFSIAGCTGCAMFGGDKKPAKSSEATLVDEMAENCRQGMAAGSVRKEVRNDEDETHTYVKCK